MTGPNAKLDASLAQACVVLGLAPPFSAEQAKTRYRELAKIYHPDVGAAKNPGRFAEIAKAYDLVSEHGERLATVKLGLQTDAAASSSQLADVLNQLHEARSKNVKSEQKLQKMSEETEVLRGYLKENRAFTTRRVVATALLIGAGLVLGFLAGMFWSTGPSMLPLLPAHPVVVDSETTQTVQMVPVLSNPSFVATVNLSGSVRAAVNYTSGTIQIKGRSAALQVDPKLSIINLPQVVSVDIAAKTPAPAPIPAQPAAPATITQPTAVPAATNVGTTQVIAPDNTRRTAVTSK